MKVDLLLKNGTLVIPAVGMVQADIAVCDGKIAAIGKLSGVSAAEEMDMTDLHILPGLIDPHIHLGLYRDYEDDCRSETAGALCGGVTTTGVFFGNPAPYEDVLDEIWEKTSKAIYTDMIFHLFLRTPHQIEHIKEYREKYGIRSFKAYMCGVPNVVGPLEDGLLFNAMQRISQLGDSMICVHAENDSIVNFASNEVLSEGGDISLERWSDTHPNISEEEALYRATFFAKKANVKLYVVHLSTKDAATALPALTNDNLFVETITPYLTCTRNDGYGILGKMLPPFRDAEDVDALWEGLDKGFIHTIGNDHISLSKETKLESNDIRKATPAGPCIDTYLPACITEGHFKRNIDLVKLVEKMTINPAKIFGLYPNKGTIAVGADADLVAIDLNTEKQVKVSELASYSNFSFHEGRKFKGWPVYTFKQGQLVAKEGKVLAEPGTGRLLNKEWRKK